MMNDPYEPLPFLVPGDNKSKNRSIDENGLSAALNKQRLDDSLCGNKSYYLKPESVTSSASEAVKNNLYQVAQCSSNPPYHIERQEYAHIPEQIISSNQYWPAASGSGSLCYSNGLAQSRNKALWRHPAHFNDTCAAPSTPAHLLHKNQPHRLQVPLDQVRRFDLPTRPSRSSSAILHFDPQVGNPTMPPSLPSSVPFPFFPTSVSPGLAINSPSAFPLLQGCSTRFLPPPDNSCPLVSPNDKEFSTQFSFGVLSQMRVCTFSKINDFRSKRKKLRDGYSGLACKWCYSCPNSTSAGSGAGAGKFFPSSIKTMSDSKKTLMAIYRHLKKCPSVPSDLKNYLEQALQFHEAERQKKEFGSQRKFFTLIWNRLHDGEDKDLSAPAKRGRKA